MKKLLMLGLAVGLSVGAVAPSVAFAGASTDAALGLGAFAVFNQILGGTGIFARPAPAPVVVASPPPPVVVVPAPVVVAPPPPPPVYYAQPAPVYYAAPAPVYYPPSRVVVVRERRCPPGWARHGWCGPRW